MKRLTCSALLLLCVAACSARGAGGGSGPVDTDGAVDDSTPAGDTTPTADTPVIPEDGSVTPDVPIGADVPVGTDVPVAPDVPEGRCTNDSQCVGAQFCADGMCRPLACTPNMTTCATSTSIRTCDSRGSMSVETTCPGGARCEANRCQSPQVCTPNARSCASPTTLLVCSGDGTVNVPMMCPAGANGTPQCSDGACSLACNTGFGNCDEFASNGCEATLATDRMNCGSCGRACTSSQNCVAGTCMTSVICTPPQLNCSGVCADLTSDNANCGLCGRACTAGTTCRSGVCMTATTGGRYTRTTSTATYTSACSLTGATRLFTTASTSAPVDDNAAFAPLPFAFNFWGRPLTAGTMVNVCTNGFISLDGVASSSYTPALPSASSPNGVIAALWTDLDVTSPVCVATTGTIGSRRMIVEWPSTRIHLATSGAFGLEIILNEADGSIDILYQGTALSPTSVGIGVENLTGSDSVGGCTTGSSCAVTSSTRIRFVPSP